MRRNNLINKISQPLLIAPLFDTSMLSEFKRRHVSYEEETQAVDKIIRRYLKSREADFQRNDEAITF